LVTQPPEKSVSVATAIHQLDRFIPDFGTRKSKQAI
jgi:hypothetical protein